MSWIWSKKRRGIITTTSFLLAFVLVSLPNGTKAEEGGGGGGGGNGTNASGNNNGGKDIGPIIMNSTGQHKPYSDKSDFKSGINGWDFTGSFAKYDLAELKEENRPMPLIPEGEDQTVIIIQTSSIPSTLKKTFPPLYNGTFSINYYAKGELDMTIEVVGMNTSEVIFNYTQHDSEEEGEKKHTHEGEWGKDTVPLPHLASEGKFEILLSVMHSESEVWGASMIEVEGLTGPPSPTTTPAPTTTVAPPSNNVTNVTTVGPEQNVTLTTLPPQGNTTVVPVTTEGGGDGEMSRLESVAKAVWDAFYVFLALFCACLLALVALIIHGRCKYVGSYPLHRETA